MTRFRTVVRSSIPTLAATAALFLSPSGRAEAECDGSCIGTECTFQGIANAPLGEATLRIEGPPCRLVVDGIGSSGQDGVVQTGLSSDVSSCYMVTGLETPNFSGAILSTRVTILQRGVVDGTSGREISELRIRPVTNDLLRIEMDCAAIDVHSYSVEVYHDGELVADEPLTNDIPILHLPKGDVEAIACAILPSGDVYTSVRFGGPVEMTLQTIGGPVGPITGECVRMRGLAPDLLPSMQESIENVFKDTGPVTITSLYAGLLPSVDSVCPEAIVAAEPTSWSRLKARYR